MSDEAVESSNASKDPQESSNQRLEAAGWALFLIMLGCLWLVPEGKVPQSAWLFGAGVILLGLNGVRIP